MHVCKTDEVFEALDEISRSKVNIPSQLISRMKSSRCQSSLKVHLFALSFPARGTAAQFKCSVTLRGTGSPSPKCHRKLFNRRPRMLYRRCGKRTMKIPQTGSNLSTHSCYF